MRDRMGDVVWVSNVSGVCRIVGVPDGLDSQRYLEPGT